MARKLLSVLVLLIIVGVAGCAQNSQAAQSETPKTSGTQSPEAVTKSFYTWYLDYVAFDEETQSRGNPLVDGAYKNSPYLSQGLIANVEETLASFQDRPGGYDPFLQAQDIPERFTVESGEISENKAEITVHTYWAGNEQPYNLKVTLESTGGKWLISEIVKAE
ncbi:MAG: DUF3828 domain-containing protein [Anaerolineae bacterium]|nr:DUF3828 domain-containing protein [Anaerolineae bacterium]